MKTVEFRPNKSKLVGLFFLTIAMVVMCFFCTTLDQIAAKVVGWIGVAFISLAFLLQFSETCFH